MADYGTIARAVPLDAQIAAVKREIGMRARVYPRRVAEGRMSREEMDKETDAMIAALATLEEVKAERAPRLL